MPETFDAELYLRLAVERALLNQPSDRYTPWDSPVVEIASALVAVDALDSAAARGIADDYALAASLRGGGAGGPGGALRPAGAQPATPPQPLTPARVVACNRDLEQSWGRLRVHYVALGDRSASVAFSAFESSPGALMQAVSGRGGPGPAGLSLRDDRGTSAHAGFNGGSGAGPGVTMQGQLVTFSPLSRSTRWVDLPEGRVELGDEAAEPAGVRVEPLPPAPPAARYLLHRVAASRHGFFPGMPTEIENAIETLVAVGSLVPDDPVIDEVRAIATGFVQPGAAVPGGLPLPWTSVFARLGRQDGPTGAVAVGAVTPPIDGVVVSVDAILSTPNGFEARVATSPGTFFAQMPFEVSVDDTRISWWAEDDLGNHYLGGVGSWGGDASLVQGTVHYQPPLDRNAKELRLQLTARSERAVVTVKLPDWETIT